MTTSESYDFRNYLEICALALLLALLVAVGAFGETVARRNALSAECGEGTVTNMPDICLHQDGTWAKVDTGDAGHGWRLLGVGAILAMAVGVFYWRPRRCPSPIEPDLAEALRFSSKSVTADADRA